MGWSIFFIALLSFCLASCIDTIGEGRKEEDGGKIGFGVVTGIITAVSLILNVTCVSRELKHPKLQVNELPRIDTVIHIVNQDTTRTYILDFTQMEQPAKHVH